MKPLKYILLISLVTWMFTSCDDFLGDNINPDKNVVVTAELELPVVLFYASQINYDHAEYGNYLTQTFTTGGKSQTGVYAYKSGWEFLTMNRHPQWRRHFYDIGVNVNEMIKDAQKEKSYNFELIGRTVKLMSTLFTTDVFGDMPLSQAYNSIAPTYDTQEDIYKWMLKEADDLIALYNNEAWTKASTNKPINIKMDRIFAGDLAKWKAFTYGLKARILLRKLPNWDNTPENCQLIINAVDSAMSGGSFPEPNYYYDGGSGEKSSPWSSLQPSINTWESRKNEMDKAIPTKFFVKDIMGLYDSPSASKGKSEDPRLERLMTPRSGPTNDPSDSFRFLEANIGMGVSYKETNYPDLFKSVYSKNNSYVSLMLTEELLMIKAEALYWMKNKKTEAYDVMMTAVNRNIERHRPTDPTENARYNVYVNRFKPMVKYFPGSSSFNIGHLMRHKYVCMYLQPELWNDMRRYNYSNSTNGKTYDGAVIYPGLKRPYNLYEAHWRTPEAIANESWVQRLNYDPETEEKYNRPELERLGAYRNSEWLKKPMIWAVYNETVK